MASSEFYRQRVQHFSQQGRQIEKIIKRYSIIRILIFLAAGIVIYIGISQPYFFWLLPLLILVFSFLVSKQTHHEEERQLMSYLEQLNANEADAFEFKSIIFLMVAGLLMPTIPTVMILIFLVRAQSINT
jgi:hypothetical protein